MLEENSGHGGSRWSEKRQLTPKTKISLRSEKPGGEKPGGEKPCVTTKFLLPSEKIVKTLCVTMA